MWRGREVVGVEFHFPHDKLFYFFLLVFFFFLLLLLFLFFLILICFILLFCLFSPLQRSTICCPM